MSIYILYKYIYEYVYILYIYIYIYIGRKMRVKACKKTKFLD